MVAPPLFHPLPPRRPGNENINHKPYTNLIDFYKASIHTSIPAMTNSKCATITLSFSDQMVRACMAMAQTPCALEGSGSHPSTFEALAGLFWFCISRVKGVREGLMDMSIALDMRKVLGLDKCFFGNCVVYNKVNYATGFKEINGVLEATKAIGEVVTKMDIEGISDLIEWFESNDHQYHPSMNGCDLICASLEGVEPYLAMFDEGFAPIRVSYYVEPIFGQGHVLILPSHPGEGPFSRVVMVTLPEDEALRVCNDDLILQFSPTIVMGV